MAASFIYTGHIVMSIDGWVRHVAPMGASNNRHRILAGKPYENWPTGTLKRDMRLTFN